MMTKPTAYRVAKRIERQHPFLRATVIPFEDENHRPYWSVYCVTGPSVGRELAAYVCEDGRTLEPIGGSPELSPVARGA